MNTIFCIFLQHRNTAHPFAGPAFPLAAVVPAESRLRGGQGFLAAALKQLGLTRKRRGANGADRLWLSLGAYIPPHLPLS